MSGEVENSSQDGYVGAFAGNATINFPGMPVGISWPNPTPLHSMNLHHHHQQQQQHNRVPTFSQQPGAEDQTENTDTVVTKNVEMMSTETQPQPSPTVPGISADSPNNPIDASVLPFQQMVMNMNNPAAMAAFLQTQQLSAPSTYNPPPQQQLRPTYVNAKQFHRIIRRRETRAILQEHYRKQLAERADSRKAYQHESRHRHAMKRPRGSHGRFLCKEELSEYYRMHPEEDPSNLMDNVTAESMDSFARNQKVRETSDE